ncbi:MAG: hypothetical protein SOS24_00305 [Clostridia bacterium]|nr:hypothetical protein [Clostridia bacterium]
MYGKICGSWDASHLTQADTHGRQVLFDAQTISEYVRKIKFRDCKSEKNVV